MTTRLRKALAVVAGTSLIAAGFPAAAALASDLPVIHSARSDFDGDRGTLLVTVSAPLGVEAIQARLTTVTTGEEVAATDDFLLRSGTTTSGIWATAQPFLLDELGSYRVHVAVTDTGGNHVVRENAGFLDYAVTTAFEKVELDRTTVTYEQRSVAISGVLMGRWPGTGDTRPLAGLPVSINSLFASNQVTTGEDGSFSDSVSISVVGEFVWAQFGAGNGHPFFRPSMTADFPVTIQPRETRITVVVRPDRVDRHETTTLRGRLEWHTTDGWEPIQDAQVGVVFCQFSCSTPIGVAVTNNRGRYKLEVEPTGAGRYQVSYEVFDPILFEPDPFVASAVATADILVRQPASLSDFHATRNAGGIVVVDGHLEFEDVSPAEAQVRIQFSPNGVDAWQTVATVDGTPPGLFNAELEWPVSGYWRARYPGAKDHFQPAVSPTIFVP